MLFRWVPPEPILGPYPDFYTTDDTHQNQVNLIQAVKDGQELTHREVRRTRDPSLGTVPYPLVLQGQPPHANNPHDHVSSWASKSSKSFLSYKFYTKGLKRQVKALIDLGSPKKA